MQKMNMLLLGINMVQYIFLIEIQKEYYKRKILQIIGLIVFFQKKMGKKLLYSYFLFIRC